MKRRRPALDPEAARKLLEEYTTEPNLLGMTRRTTPFREQQCEHCGGLHARNCPAVAEVRYYRDGHVKSVQFWAKGMWDESEVLWLADVIAAAEG